MSLHAYRYTGDYDTEIVDIFDGTAGSPCYNPCLSTKVHNKNENNLHKLLKVFFQLFGSTVANEKTSLNYSTIDLTFDQDITITKSYYAPVSFTKLFSDLGGSLGLWLGIGIIQICILVVNFAARLRKD